MIKKNASVADSVAAEMADLMDNSSFRSIFHPGVVKTAAAKNKCKCPPFCKCVKKHGKDVCECKGMKPKSKKEKKAEKLDLVYEGLNKISETLDSLGLEKSASSTLVTLRAFMKEAQDTKILDLDDDLVGFDGDEDSDPDDEEAQALAEADAIADMAEEGDGSEDFEDLGDPEAAGFDDNDLPGDDFLVPSNNGDEPADFSLADDGGMAMHQEIIKTIFDSLVNTGEYSPEDAEKVVSELSADFDNVKSRFDVSSANDFDLKKTVMPKTELQMVRDMLRVALFRAKGDDEDATRLAESISNELVQKGMLHDTKSGPEEFAMESVLDSQPKTSAKKNKRVKVAQVGDDAAEATLGFLGTDPQAGRLRGAPASVMPPRPTPESLRYPVRTRTPQESIQIDMDVSKKPSGPARMHVEDPFARRERVNQTARDMGLIDGVDHDSGYDVRPSVSKQQLHDAMRRSMEPPKKPLMPDYSDLSLHGTGLELRDPADTSNADDMDVMKLVQKHDVGAPMAKKPRGPGYSPMMRTPAGAYRDPQRKPSQDGLDKPMDFEVDMTQNADDMNAEASEASILRAFAAAKKKLDPKAKVRNRGECVFQSDHSKVKDKKDHFPLTSESQARNALAQASKFSEAPAWYSGSLKSLVSAVASAVGKKYPKIKLSDKSKTPGKG